MMFAADLAQRDLLAQQRGERSFGSARDMREQFGTIQADAAEGELRRGIGYLRSMQAEIAVRMMGWIVHQHQMRAVLALLQRCSESRQMSEIVIAIHVTVDHGERLITEQVQGERDAARRFQRRSLGRVADMRTE